MEVLTNLRDESLSRVIVGLSDLIACGETIKHEEENIRRFTEHMIYVREIINKLQSQQSGDQFSHSSTASGFLRRMEIAVNDARETIEEYKSNSQLVRLLSSRFVVSKLNKSSNEIAEALHLLSLTLIVTSLDIESNVVAMIHSLKSMELKLVANAIYSKLHQYISENSGNRQHTDPPADGATSSNSVEAEFGESINDAHQFTLMLESWMASPIQRESTTDEIESIPDIFFLCPLTKKLMEDPVNVSCNHSYERKAIEESFRNGQKCCRLCKKELVCSSSGRLELTPNLTLLGAISEWKRRDARINDEKNAKKKLRDAAERITLDNSESANRAALDDLMDVMEKMPSCISEATESPCKLVPKLAQLLKNRSGNTGLVLHCLLRIARFSHENKETIGKGGVIKCLLMLSNTEPVAVEILLELSMNAKIAQKILETKDSIPILVSLLDPNSSLAEKARAVLKNFSPSFNNTILMAKSGHLTPFLDEFNKQVDVTGNSEDMRALMAEQLAQMQLTDTAANKLNNEHFIAHLAAMVIYGLPRSQLASLKCIKSLITFNGIRISFLSTVSTMVALLFIITDTGSEQQSKKEAFEIIFSLIAMSQPLEEQNYPGLQRLYSFNSIHNLLEQIKSSSPDDQLSLLRLLLAMFQKFDTAKDWIISDQKAMSHLFSAVSLNMNAEVRFNAFKLIECITGNYPGDIPLPSPDKETALSSIITALTESRTDEEASIAANIISHLPCGDKSMDAMLQRSAVLNAIQDLISDANKSNEVSQNALGALLRCINKSNSEFLIQVSKLEPDLVQKLSTGASPLVKQRAAMILAHLARCAPESSAAPNRPFHFRRPSWHNSSSRCTVHESCSLQRITCLVKAGAVKPLIDMVDHINPDASKEALMALDTLFDTGNLELSTSQSSINRVAANTIVENKGAAPILQVLERGPLPLKKAALELFGKIHGHPGITSEESKKFKAMLFCLVKEENELKQKARKLLAEMFSNHCFSSDST